MSKHTAFNYIRRHSNVINTARATLTTSSSVDDQGCVAIVMGVANARSLAWACVEALLRRHPTLDCVVTYQHERSAGTIQKLIAAYPQRILGALPCNVEDENAIPRLFHEELPPLLTDRPLQSVLHSIAYANLQSSPTLLQTSLKDYLQAQHISSFSFLQTAQCSLDLLKQQGQNSSITTLSYIGAHRAMPGYSLMGPCKASLESMVYGLAAECRPVRVNAVSAGPIPTVSARGIPSFRTLQQAVAQASPLQRPVTSSEVGEMVAFLATHGTGVTGQVLYVDGGYSHCSGQPLASGLDSSDTLDGFDNSEHER
jgi:enoyl-[acyl-carrier protein] reductase I